MKNKKIAATLIGVLVAVGIVWLVNGNAQKARAANLNLIGGFFCPGAGAVLENLAEASGENENITKEQFLSFTQKQMGVQMAQAPGRQADVFALLDADSNGNISKQEAEDVLHLKQREGLEKLFYCQTAATFLQAIVRGASLDDSGVNKKEYRVIAMREMKKRAATVKERRENIFKVVDSNLDGILSRAEIAKVKERYSLYQ